MTNIVPMDSFSLLTVLWIRRKTFNINHPRPLNLYVKLAPFHLCFYWEKKIKVPSPFFNNGYFQRPSKVSFPLSCLKGLLSPEELRLLPLETWLIQGNINSVSLFLSLSHLNSTSNGICEMKAEREVMWAVIRHCVWGINCAQNKLSVSLVNQSERQISLGKTYLLSWKMTLFRRLFLFLLIFGN